MRQFIVIILAYLLLAGAPIATAQGSGNTCPAVVEAALSNVNRACNALGRDEACYGNTRVEATFWEPQDELIFSAPADRAPLRDLHTIATAPLNTQTGEWGLALLNLQANLPDTLPGQAVTFLLMGDASLENAVLPEETAEDQIGPMQAFYFTTGLGAPTCNEAPDALIVQSTERAEVTLNINELEIRLGSTVVFSMAEIPGEENPSAVMVATLLQGRLETVINGTPLILEQPEPTPEEPLPTFAVTLNAEGRVDADSQLVEPPLDVVTPVVEGACLSATRSTVFHDLAPELCQAGVGVPYAPPPTVTTVPESPPEDEADEANAAHVHLLWHNRTCEGASQPLPPIVSFGWGLGCFDTAASARAHPHAAEYRLFVDGEPVDMSPLQQIGPEQQSPVCPWGYSYYLPPLELPPGEHILSLTESIVDGWQSEAGGHEIGESSRMSCTIIVER